MASTAKSGLVDSKIDHRSDFPALSSAFSDGGESAQVNKIGNVRVIYVTFGVFA